MKEAGDIKNQLHLSFGMATYQSAQMFSFCFSVLQATHYTAKGETQAYLQTLNRTVVQSDG